MYHARWLLVAGCCLGLSGCSKDTARSTSPTQPPPLAIGAGRAAIEIVSGDGQLGTADFGERRQCVFTIRNNTNQAMRLSVADKSCTCAGARLEPDQVESGQSCTLTMLWIPKAEVIETTSIRLWTEIRDETSRSSLRLEATATLEPKVQFAFPRGPLDFGKLDATELESAAKILVVEAYSTRGPFQLQSVRPSLDGIHIMGQAEPMTSDRLAQLNAQAGYRISIKPTAALPTGRFLAFVQLVTSFTPQPLELPVTGSYETGIVSLSQERIELPPRLHLSQGYRVPSITLTVRQGICLACEVEGVLPSGLQAKATKIDQKSWRIDVSLPAGLNAEQAKLTPEQWRELLEFGFDQGQLTLRLDHPQVKIVQIPITGAQLVQ